MSEDAKTLVTEEAKEILASVLVQHEPSQSHYGDITCICGEEFAAGDTAVGSGYRRWASHVATAYESEANRRRQLRGVDAMYR